MIFTNFKIGLRNIVKNKGFFALNSGGLIVGLTAVLLVSLWVYSELNFNKSLKNYNEIASVMLHKKFSGEIKTIAGQPLQLAPVLREEYGSHFKEVATCSQTSDFNIKYKDQMTLVEGRFVEPGMVNILDLKMVSGNRDALQDISSLLISESTAKNIFGTENPLGKTLQISAALDVTVAGVYKDLPINSTFKNIHFLGPWELLNKNAGYEERLSWGNQWFRVYVQVQDEKSMANVSSLIKDVYMEKYTDRNKKRSYELFLFPISKWHLYSEFENGVNVGGKIEYVTIFSIIGFFILLLACINFMNLSTAQALRRGKEVGVRKTLGSSRKQLIVQFFTESFMMIFFSFVLALTLAYVLLPGFNTVTLKQVEIPFAELGFWLICFALIILTAILSSLYPSLFLSGFKPVSVLKGLGPNSKTPVSLRKVLIVVQFAISGILIMGTLTVIGQINHVQDRPIGFDKELLVSVPINNKNVRESFGVIQRELLASPHISQVTASDVKITRAYTNNGGDFDWKNKDPNLEADFSTIRATLGFGEMIGWNILEGRDFSAEFPSDTLAFIVNETAVKYMKLDNPVGEFVRWGKKSPYKIIGVVEDMVTRSPFDPVLPALYILHDGRFLSWVNVKIASDDPNTIEGAIASMKQTFQKHDPNNIFSYSFMDEEHERKFNAINRIAKLVLWFSLVAIFISCLGVLGLSTYMAIQRKKEIGIRKVLGASIRTIWQMLSKQFIVLVLISLAIALPLGYYFSSQWLMEYSYRIQVNFWIFSMASGIILGITLVTVSYQSIKSATSNPVDSLRTE
jgi:ABC-type antimicrobial peptide transport system permease subunit